MTSTLSGSAEPAVEQHALPPSMVERLTLILELFDRPQTHLTLEGVAQRTHLPRSTAHRILDQLVRLRWLERPKAGYRLGPRALKLGGREVGHSTLRVAAAPVLHELAIRTGLVVHLGVLDGTGVYYLDKVGGRQALEVPSRVGGRAPAHATALGKAMLAWLPPEQVDAEYQAGLHRRTPGTIGDLETLHQELHRVRREHGLAFERGECFPGIACIGIALRGPDGPVGAVSLVGGPRTPLERLTPVMVSTARTIVDDLFELSEPTRPEAITLPSWSAESMAHLLALGQNQEWL